MTRIDSYCLCPTSPMAKSLFSSNVIAAGAMFEFLLQIRMSVTNSGGDSGKKEEEGEEERMHFQRVNNI